MSNQLMSARSVPPGALDAWQQPQQGMGFAVPQAAPPAAPQPLQKMGRLLRGKLWLAVILGLILGTAGGIAGFKSQKPTYTAAASLQITPIIPRIIDADKVMPLYQNFMATEASTLSRDSELIREAMKDPAYLEAKGAASPEAIAPISPNLKAAFAKGTYVINLSYDNEDKNLAEATLSSIVRAYQRRYNDSKSDNATLRRTITAIEDRKERFAKDVYSYDELIRAESKPWNTSDLAPLHISAGDLMRKQAEELRMATGNFEASKMAVESMQKNNAQISAAELANADPQLQKMLGNQVDEHNRRDSLVGKYGLNSPVVQELDRQLAILDKQVTARIELDRLTILGTGPSFDGTTTLIVTPQSLRTAEMRMKYLQGELAKTQAEYAALGTSRMKIEEWKAKIDQSRDELKTTEDRLEKLTVDGAQRGDLMVQNYGKDTAVMSTDKSKMMAVAGGLGGAAIPVGLLMLWGLTETRYKYSDDATTNMSGVPLLGILPNLPDRLSDPAQASIAAHCVHQIRTMLQLNAMRDDSTAFAITSASSGDGKTSLSLALGLSFAASGSRTLLIDSDLIGGGLSSRLGINSNVGVVEALAGRSVTEVAQATDVQDLSILPVGLAQAHHAGGFSPPAVRRMIADAKKHYEVVIIDTGPVMGSIEATPICASVDGVVLTVARGQSRPLVERAIAHMGSVGAKLAGVVFNRAQHKDFEQSIGAISIRSAARSAAASGAGHNGHDNTGHIGPVARAVATSVRGENN